jgi:hypothetical protein
MALLGYTAVMVLLVHRVGTIVVGMQQLINHVRNVLKGILLYMSSTLCDEFTEEDIWTMFFEVMDGHNWPADDKNNWSDPNVPLCEWGGMVCDEKGEVISVAFPLESAMSNVFDD